MCTFGLFFYWHSILEQELDQDEIILMTGRKCKIYSSFGVLITKTFGNLRTFYDINLDDQRGLEQLLFGAVNKKEEFLS